MLVAKIGIPRTILALAASLSCLAFPSARGQPLGSLAADRSRLAEITGDSSQLVWRGTTPLVDVLPFLANAGGTAADARLLLPSVLFAWNSAIPYSGNDGPLWSGRGANLSVNGGVAFSRRLRQLDLRVQIAPTLVYSQNLPFQVFPNRVPGRSGWANPFHGPGASLDLPHRFGDRHLLRLDPGSTGIEVAWPVVAVGATTANEWWGPGRRNAIVMSNNAPGIPRLYARTARPFRSRIGALDAKIISGTLTQSQFFSDLTNQNRTLSGVLVQLRPAFDSTLTFGFARVVYAPIGPDASPFTLTLARTLDALARWENLDGPPGQRSDQIAAIFARWIFPTAGFEVYGEWARMDLPRTGTELLVAGHHTGGWTFGFQYAQPKRRGAYLRLQSELTYLEQSRVFPDRVTPDFYSGMASQQGYTQRGQIIGAAIGPGASSQWIAIDWLARRWEAGVFVGRARWDNDTMYREPGKTFFHHDVSVWSGLRGGWRAPRADFSAELTVARRYNYLFQNGLVSPGGFRTIDVNNLTLVLAATPR